MSPGHRQLCDRVLSWLSNVHPACPPPSTPPLPDHDTPSTSHRASSPSSSASWHSSQLPPVSPEVSSYAMDLDDEENISLYRYRSDIYGNVPEFSMFYGRSPLDGLPDPVSNPLITLSPDVIEEEYARILEMRNDLQAEYDDLLRQQSMHMQPKQIYDWTIEQKLFETSLAIQKTSDAATYIVDFAFRHNIHIDFLTISLCHIRLPQQPPLPTNEIFNYPIADQSYGYGHGLQHQTVGWVS